MKTKIIALIMLATLVASCEREDSADVNQDRIHTTYSLIYNANEDVTYARAWFRFGSITGTLLELTSPSAVSFNNSNLAFNSTFAYYEKQFAGKVSSGTFHWKDYDGLEFDNSISMSDIAFPTNLTEISGDQAYELHWVGKNLEEGEYVAISINGDFEGDATIHTQNNTGSSSIVIPKTALQELPKDREASFWMEFGLRSDLSQATGAGGEIYGKYRLSKDIMIK